MQIQIDEEYRLRTIPRNYLLEKRIAPKEKEDGTKTKESWADAGAYSTIKGLIKGYTRRAIIESQANSWDQVLEEIERLEKKIDRLDLSEKRLKEIVQDQNKEGSGK